MDEVVPGHTLVDNERYQELLHIEAFMQALEAAGADNCEAWEQAVAEFYGA